MTVYLASFKGKKSGWQGLVEHLVCWATKGIYSHTEICVGNPFEGEVLCVSSVGVDNGVRGKLMRLSPKDWDIVPTKAKTETVIKFLEDHKGEPYDVIGCVRTLLPFVSKEHPRAWFCSEVAGTILGFEEPYRFYPSVLHVVAKN